MTIFKYIYILTKQYLKIINILFFCVISFIITIFLIDEPLWILYNSTDTHIFSDFIITTHISSAIITFFYFYLIIIFLLKNNLQFLFIFFSIINTKMALFFCLINLLSGILWGLPIWGVSIPLEDSRFIFMVIYLIFLLIFLNIILNIDIKNMNKKYLFIFYLSSLFIIPIIKFIISHWATLHQPDLILGLYFENLNLSFLIYIYILIYIYMSLIIYLEIIYKNLGLNFLVII